MHFKGTFCSHSMITTTHFEKRSKAALPPPKKEQLSAWRISNTPVFASHPSDLCGMNSRQLHLASSRAASCAIFALTGLQDARWQSAKRDQLLSWILWVTLSRASSQKLVQFGYCANENLYEVKLHIQIFSKFQLNLFPNSRLNKCAAARSSHVVLRG